MSCTDWFSPWAWGCWDVSSAMCRSPFREKQFRPGVARAAESSRRRPGTGYSAQIGAVVYPECERGGAKKVNNGEAADTETRRHGGTETRRNGTYTLFLLRVLFANFAASRSHASLVTCDVGLPRDGDNRPAPTDNQAMPDVSRDLISR